MKFVRLQSVRNRFYNLRHSTQTRLESSPLTLIGHPEWDGTPIPEPATILLLAGGLGLSYLKSLRKK